MYASQYYGLDRVNIWEYCQWLERQPNQCSTFIPRSLLDDKETRRDVLYFTHGHGMGWRLRKNWREVLRARNQWPAVRVVVDVNSSLQEGGLVVPEIAALLGVRDEKVREWCRTGQLPAEKKEWGWTVEAGAFMEWMAARGKPITYENLLRFHAEGLTLGYGVTRNDDWQVAGFGWTLDIFSDV